MRKIILFLVFLSSFSWVFADSLGDVSVSFCSSGSQEHSLNFAVQAGVEYPLCVKFSTTSDDKIPVSLGFVDGEITSDSLHKKACSSQGSLFAPYVYFTGDNFLLTSGLVLEKTGFLLFPPGFSGQIHGCLVYTIPNDIKSVKQKSSLFNVIVRKAKFIDGYVVGDFARDVSFLSGNIVYYVDTGNNSLVVSLPFIDSGMLPELLVFTGTLRNSLGYKRSVLSSEVFSGSSPFYLSFRFEDIPFYKGKYTFSFDGYSVLDTRLDLSYLPEKVKQPIFFSSVFSLFLVPWTLIFWSVGILVGLFVLRKLLKLILRR